MRRPEQPREPGHLGSRLLWFVALWVAGVAVTGAIAYLIRMVLQ